VGDTGESLMSGSDKDKTVFGGALPGFGAQPQRPSGIGQPPADGDRTVIGGALPIQPRPAAPPGMGQPGGFQPTAPAPQQPYGAPPAGGNTWLGGALPPQQPYQPPAPQPYQQPYQQPYPPQPAAPPGYQAPPAYGAPSGIGQALGAPEGFFPQMPSQRPQAPVQMQQPRISLDAALRASGLGKGGSSNALVAAAANLLILFGRLRTGLVEMQAMPLMDHVTREIDLFERNAVESGCDPHEAQVGKYVLCGTADDIVQNLPGSDRGVWEQYSMVARFFQQRNSGVGFFMEAEKAMQAPGQRFQLLELMLTCLSLGFEGQYRTLPNGAVELARIRAAIYETLRRVKARPDEDVSVAWTAVPMGGRRKFGGVPIWAVAALALAAVVGAYAGLSTLLARDGGVVARTLNLMHPNSAAITLVRSAPIVAAYVAPVDTTQLERISAALQARLDDGSVAVGTKGDYIFVRVSNLLLFDSGKATVKPEFAALAGEIAAMLNAEGGPIRILGFTDSTQMSGRGQYKSNDELSLARAEAVREVIAATLEADDRMTAEGKGEADPIGDNETEEGRALNRRVEILLAKEGTY
jgi:type VI secretion system protein ImpK